MPFSIINGFNTCFVIIQKGIPQTDCYEYITLEPYYLMSTVIQYKHDQKQSQQTPVESEIKNPFPAITAMDMIGLTWIFKKDEDILEEFK